MESDALELKETIQRIGCIIHDGGDSGRSLSAAIPADRKRIHKEIIRGRERREE